MQTGTLTRADRRNAWLCLAFVTVLSLFTYVYNYQYPKAFFWDENYHVASAQKYLNGVYFMEQHPPLGKLLIALGEKIVHGNPQNDQFIGTDYARNPPKDFDLAGYRLFPVLLAWLAAPLLFLIFLTLTGSALRSTLFSFLYIFDNALIVHMRGAMLESTLMFFSALTILAFLLTLKWKDKPRHFLLGSLLFGLSFGCVMTTKVVGLIFILLIPVVLWQIRNKMPQIGTFLGVFLVGFALTYVGVWQTHFALGSTIVESNNDKGFYQASEKYKQILADGTNGSLLSFPTMIKDSWYYVKHYNGGVPRLDMCKTDENGSPFFYWPFGGRSISYRWETPDGKIYKYLYLQSNPVVWAAGLIGVFLALVLLLSQVLVQPKQKCAHTFNLCLFLGLYLCYMAAMSQLTRVMYLYHYFLPLMFTMVLFALVIEEIRQLGTWKLTDGRKAVFLLAFSALVLFSYKFYAPLTYYEALNDEQFKARDIFPLWDLHCVNCKRNNLILTPKASSK